MWLPHGARIYNTILDYLREVSLDCYQILDGNSLANTPQQYWKRDYHEVITANMYSSAMFKTSGHWQHYKDDSMSSFPLVGLATRRWLTRDPQCSSWTSRRTSLV